MTHKKMDTVELDRDLNSLNEAELKQNFYNLKEQEIINLCAHPLWEDFSKEFKQLIYDSIADFLHRDVQLMRQTGSE
jgi:hypothetical protein